jgi:hypothetical protein
MDDEKKIELAFKNQGAMVERVAWRMSGRRSGAGSRSL